MLISEGYRALQRQMHEQKRYGDSGGKWAYTVAGIMMVHHCYDLLDYGCGTGKMVENLRRWVMGHLTVQAQEYDPGVAGKDLPPRQPCGLVSCIDTLEHIEVGCLADVLAHLYELTDRRLFTVISTRRAGKVLPDGRNAHLIIKPVVWWKVELANAGFLLEHEWTHTADEWCALWSLSE